MSLPATPKVVAATSRPKLKRHIKLREDKSRARWVLLAPERVFTPDETAIATLKLCDGDRDVAAIAVELAKAYDASAPDIEPDIIAMLQDLADKGVLDL